MLLLIDTGFDGHCAAQCCAIAAASCCAQYQVHARVCEHWLAELPDLQRIRGCLKGRLHLARPVCVWGGGGGPGVKSG
jgi:hypothetical protein